MQYGGSTNFSDLTYEQLRDNLIDLIKKKVKKDKIDAGNAIIINPSNETGDLIKLSQ